jgi:phenylacetate-CoA ligase
LVLTTLINTAMPLIRFAIGDQASFDSEPCACGRRSPCLSQIDGREGDVITLPSGKRLSPYLLTTVIEADSSILQYRIVQTAPAAFRIDVVRRQSRVSQRSDAELCGELLKFAAEASFSVREVAVLERPANGKRSVFVRAGLAA